MQSNSSNIATPARVLVTVGPALLQENVVQEILAYGPIDFRFPLSKETLQTQVNQALLIRGVVKENPHSSRFFLDIPGSKARLSNEGGFELRAGETIALYYDRAHIGSDWSVDRDLAIIDLPVSPSPKTGDIFVLGDGEDALRVESAFEEFCLVKPLTSGLLGKHRGIVLQDSGQDFITFSERDLDILDRFPREIFTDIILSFVGSKDTIQDARRMLTTSAGDTGPRIWSKVETCEGVRNAGEIAEASDGVIIGRGDLLLDAGAIEFDAAMEDIMEALKWTPKPLFIGTQIMNSTSANWLPNRSELSYLASLVRRGVDGFLLSFETTVGKQPVRTVKLIRSVIERYSPL